MNYNVYSKDCPARLFFERLAERWILLIIGQLRDEQPKRFSELKRQVQGISQKVLSQKLKQLERDGLISRKVFATMPITVEYQLTDLGIGFAQTVEQVSGWAEQNVSRVLQAHEAYDARMAAQSEQETAKKMP